MEHNMSADSFATGIHVLAFPRVYISYGLSKFDMLNTNKRLQAQNYQYFQEEREFTSPLKIKCVLGCFHRSEILLRVYDLAPS